MLIAQKHLGVDTLDTRNSDRLDFHDVSVWEIKEALRAAFMAGLEVGVATGIKTPAATDAGKPQELEAYGEEFAQDVGRSHPM